MRITERGRCGVDSCTAARATDGLCADHAKQVAKGARYDALEARSEQLASQLSAAQAVMPTLSTVYPPDARRCVTTDAGDGVMTDLAGRCIHRRASNGDGERCIFHTSR